MGSSSCVRVRLNGPERLWTFAAAGQRTRLRTCNYYRLGTGLGESFSYTQLPHERFRYIVCSRFVDLKQLAEKVLMDLTAM